MFQILFRASINLAKHGFLSAVPGTDAGVACFVHLSSKHNHLKPYCISMSRCLACRGAAPCIMTGHSTYPVGNQLLCQYHMLALRSGQPNLCCQILFRASVKSTWFASIFCFLYVLAKNYFDVPASIFCLASMFQILFRASTKTHWLPVYYFFFMYWQTNILMGLPIYSVLPVCFKSCSVPVQKHTGCQYIYFFILYWQDRIYW